MTYYVCAGFPGRDTQGPSGSRVPEEAPAPNAFEQEDDVTYDYMDDRGEAPPDSVGGHCMHEHRRK